MVTHTLSSACTPLRLVLDESSAVGQPIGRAQAEEVLAYQALLDPLTTRPNRTLFHDRQQQATLAAPRDGSSLSFLLMNLDRFKDINAACGHACGDVLQLAAHLSRASRATRTRSRSSADEFDLHLPAITAMGATWVADKLLMADLPRWLQESRRAAAT